MTQASLPADPAPDMISQTPIMRTIRRLTVKRFALALAAALVLAQPVAAQEGPRIAHQPSARTPFSAAIQVGNTYWLSGKLGATAETRAMTEGRVAAETHNIMRSFGALLEELGMDRLVNLDMEADFIGKAALRRIRETGVSRKQVGLHIDSAPLTGPNTRFWPVSHNAKTVGQVTSAVYSPRLERNIALAMVSTECAITGATVEVALPSGPAKSTIVERPFFDPGKKLAAA